MLFDRAPVALGNLDPNFRANHYIYVDYTEASNACGPTFNRVVRFVENNGAGTDPGNFLHVNPYPNTAAPGQTHECEAGNEDYIRGRQVIGNVPGNQGTKTADPTVTGG